MLRLETLNKEQVENVYNERMVIDFPKDELWDLYQSFYRIMLPTDMFEKSIKLQK